MDIDSPMNFKKENVNIPRVLDQAGSFNSLPFITAVEKRASVVRSMQYWSEGNTLTNLAPTFGDV